MSTCRPMFSQNLLSPWKWRRSLGADNGDASGLTTKASGVGLASYCMIWASLYLAGENEETNFDATNHHQPV